MAAPLRLYENLKDHVGQLLAAADLTAKQHYFVAVNTDGKIAVAGDGVAALGVLQNKPDSGEVADVGTLGVTQVVAGGVVTAGDKVASDASGKAATATTGEYAIGIALGTTAGDGEKLSVYLNAYGRVA